ncbi:MAG: hypothetical protein D6696_15840 [Acidobacteria bacterium]|nr:MAG: hypothetical protein D6696_15840 [Acidobacteriota bacterium]
MSKLLASRTTTIVLIALVVIFGAHVVTRAAENLRLDLTADDLYSLSEGTEEILAKMTHEGVKPIEITLYFSETAGKTLPKFIKDFIAYERYVRALLREYERAAGGKIRVRYVDPVPDSDEAQDALDYGLDGKPINQHGDLFFFGLVFQTQTGSKDVIDFLWPSRQATIEYEITKRIYRLLWPQKKRVGVLSSLEVIADDSNPYMRQILAAQGKQPAESWLAMKLLEETYEVSKIDLETDSISHDDYDLVVVIHPKRLSPRALWALDEWIVTGGNALIFLDPFTVTDVPPQNPQQPWHAMQYKAASNLKPLLSAWGLAREEDKIAADFELAVTRPTSRRGGAERLLYDLVIDERHLPQAVAAGHPIVQGLSDLRFFVAGSLKTLSNGDGGESGGGEGAAASTGENGEEGVPASSSGLTFTPLITTTAKGNTLEMVPGFPGGDDLVFQDLNNPARLRDRFREGSEPVVLAYVVQGKFPTAFPDGAEVPAEPVPPPPMDLPPEIELPVPENLEKVHKDPVPEEARREATVVVFADVDFIADPIAFQNSLFGVQAANDNYKVLLNAIDYLLGSQELMKVRAKRHIHRPFTLFDEIEAQADRETLERERQLRAEIERFQEQLREKTRELGGRNAALFKKQVQDEVDQLNERIAAANRELREIRLAKRRALEDEEARVRRTTLFATPSLVLALGLFLFVRRKVRDAQARRSA